MRNSYHHTKNLHLQLTITDEENKTIKTLSIPVDDYIDKRIGAKCQNVADDMISNMIKVITQEKHNN